ncbi:ATP-binding protein [Perlucidibaca piscinae]|uniref:ATP-binding protein n=1 Tax=Perlucidibaca piscinae TaxID=392589 RepID=UPI0003B43850|nr:ATP-binding protein [Perlucidibaca piscinae]
MSKPLAISQLYRATPLKNLPFRNTRRLKPVTDFLGQERARESVEMAVAMPHDGYNLFAIGHNGLGKGTMIRRYLESVARQRTAPSDWIYVNNFKDPRYPQAIELPAGLGTSFKQDIHKAWRKLSERIMAAFESERYQERREGLKGELARVQQDALTQLAAIAEKQGVKLVLRTPGGYGFSPMAENGDVMAMEAMSQLPPARQQRLKEAMTDMDNRLRKVARKLDQIEERNREHIDTLNEEVALAVIDPILSRLTEKYQAHPQLVVYLKAYRSDLLDHLELVLNAGDNQDATVSVGQAGEYLPPVRYQVNAIVSRDPKQGAPVIVEDLPTHYNLLGHVEQVTYMGTVATDFTLIRPGALHRANGGFLIIEAEQVLEHPYAWQSLKRALRAKSLKLSSLEQMLTLTGTVSLEPEPIPLNLKLVLLGDRETFYLLQEFDPELETVFKMRADFESDMPRTPENELTYAHFLADIARQEQLLPLDRSGVARLIEESARTADDQDLLSLHARSAADLLREANYCAGLQGADCITSGHVLQALQGRERRHDRIRRLYLEDIGKGSQLFSCEGEVVGQVNGLTVVSYGDASFGLPSRISVTAHYGGGEITDIERDVELGGAIHSKGVLILTSYLKARFGAEHPLRFAANIAFEQSYSGVDGDSASLGELCGLLSAIGKLPVRQSWGITGSVNQFGEVQPIGGVNEKIEGFFAACQLKGLTGEQGVIIPVQNVRHLMLRDEVLDAVRAGKFRIHAVSQVEEAVALLLGKPAGMLDKEGNYPEGSVFAAVAERFAVWHDAEKDDDDDDKPEEAAAAKALTQAKGN